MTTVLLVLVTVILMYAPATLYSIGPPLNGGTLAMVLIFKTCLAVRLLGWIVDRRIYDRTSFSGVYDFFEYLFCPIFFVFPGQIQFVQYDYFHRSKSVEPSMTPNRNILMLALWGLALVAAFSYCNQYYIASIYPRPAETAWISSVWSFFWIGLFWVVVVYFEQAGGMSFQVALARAMGYQLKYDMHQPLAARSPLDYLRRHSSYTLDYIVGVVFKPIALPLLRMGLSSSLVYFFGGLVSYCFVVGAQTGYRTDFDRPWSVTFALFGFLMLYLVFSIFGGPNAGSISSPTKRKELGNWSPRDFAAWLSTMLLIGLSKSVIVLLKNLSMLR